MEVRTTCFPCLPAQCAQNARHEIPVGDRTPRRLSFRIDLPVLPPAPLLASHGGPLGSASPCSFFSTHSVPKVFVLDTPVGTSVVADDLRPCVSADHEHLCTSREACVDEDDFTSRGFAKVDALVDKPSVEDQLHNFRHINTNKLPDKKLAQPIEKEKTRKSKNKPSLKKKTSEKKKPLEKNPLKKTKPSKKQKTFEF